MVDEALAFDWFVVCGREPQTLNWLQLSKLLSPIPSHTGSSYSPLIIFAIFGPKSQPWSRFC